MGFKRPEVRIFSPRPVKALGNVDFPRVFAFHGGRRGIVKSSWKLKKICSIVPPIVPQIRAVQRPFSIANCPTIFTLFFSHEVSALWLFFVCRAWHDSCGCKSRHGYFTAKCSEPQAATSNGRRGRSGVAKPKSLRTETGYEAKRWVRLQKKPKPER